MITVVFAFFSLVCFIISQFKPRRGWYIPAGCFVTLALLVLLTFAAMNYADNVTIRHLEGELNKGDIDAQVLRTKLAVVKANREQVRWMGWFGKGD